MNQDQNSRCCDKALQIGEVYYMHFLGVGSEQSGWRPGLVFQNNIGNKFSPNIIAIPLTSSIKKTSQPTHVVLRSEDTGLRIDSMVLCENPERMSKERVGDYITTLSDDQMARVAEASLLASCSIAYLDVKQLLDIRERAITINNSAAS